jgi:hypothetical protein
LQVWIGRKRDAGKQQTEPPLNKEKTFLTDLWYCQWYREDRMSHFDLFWSVEELKLHDAIQDLKREILAKGEMPAYRGMTEHVRRDMN